MKQEKFPPTREIETALIKVSKIFRRWGPTNQDWVVVDEIAYFLQGYEVMGKEMQTRHLDIYVDTEKLPWHPSVERSIIPPPNSRFFEKYTEFMKDSGFGLDMLKKAPGIFEQPVVLYKLKNGNEVQLMEVGAMTRQFWEKTLMHYSLEDVGEEKVREWLDKLKLIRTAAIKRENRILADDCSRMIVEAQKRWSHIL